MLLGAPRRVKAELLLTHVKYNNYCSHFTAVISPMLHYGKPFLLILVLICLSVAAIKTTSKRNSGEEIVYLVYFSSSQLIIWEVRVRTQTRSETEIMKECCLLAWCLALAQTVFVHFPDPPA